MTKIRLMPLLFLLLFILLPLAELAVLIKVSDFISLGPTLLLVVTNSLIGLFMLRQQGLGSLRRAQQALDEGRLPVEGVMDAAGLLVAGALLLTPGLITDAIGFLLLVPYVRHAVGRYLFERARKSPNVRIDIFGMNSREEGFHRQPPFGRPGGSRGAGTGTGAGPGAGGGPIIEGEIIAPEPKDDKPGEGRSPWRR